VKLIDDSIFWCSYDYLTCLFFLVFLFLCIVSVAWFSLFSVLCLFFSGRLCFPFLSFSPILSPSSSFLCAFLFGFFLFSLFSGLSLYTLSSLLCVCSLSSPPFAFSVRVFFSQSPVFVPSRQCVFCSRSYALPGSLYPGLPLVFFCLFSSSFSSGLTPPFSLGLSLSPLRPPPSCSPVVFIFIGNRTPLHLSEW